MNARDVLSDYDQLGAEQSPKLAGEPVFVLRAQDKIAPALVRLWVSFNSLNPECPVEKLAKAQEVAHAMDRWPIKKWAD